MASEEAPQVKDLDALKEWISGQDDLQVAEELAHLSPEERAEAFLLLDKERALVVFEQLASAHQGELLEVLGHDQILRLIEEMEPDDRARLFAEISPTIARKVLSQLSPYERRMTGLLMRYPEESAGRIMIPEFITLKADATVGQAMQQIRTEGPYTETIYTLPVVDENHRLVGMTELEDLVLAPPEKKIGDLMKIDIRSVRGEDDQETVARLIQSADVLAVPVVDDEGRLVGLVTIDDAMDVLDLEESEDLVRTGGAEPLRRPYFSVTVFGMA